MLTRPKFWLLTAFLALGFGVTPTLHAQGYTYQVLHSFNGVSDGKLPLDGVIIDPSGDLYGTTSAGQPGDPYGTVYELKKHDGSFTFNVLHAFHESEGYGPAGRPFRAQDGTLYGTTFYGGPSNAGTFYHLTPPPTFPRTPIYPWSETILYEFTRDVGTNPSGDLTFDQQGNAYGTTEKGGGDGGGTVYELVHSGNSWTGMNLFSFPVVSGLPSTPVGGVTFDLSGNLWGITELGGQYVYGTVFEMTPHGASWMESTIYNFDPSQPAGGRPRAGLILDALGNLYGDTPCCGSGGQGAAFEITNGGQTLNTLYNFTQGNNPNDGPQRKLTMDSEGSLYGTTYGGGANNLGCVFKLTPMGEGQWMYTDLHDFDGSNGEFPESTVTMDSNGNLYGTTYLGGTGTCGGAGCGTVWELSPQ